MQPLGGGSDGGSVSGRVRRLSTASEGSWKPTVYLLSGEADASSLHTGATSYDSQPFYEEDDDGEGEKAERSDALVDDVHDGNGPWEWFMFEMET